MRSGDSADQDPLVRQLREQISDNDRAIVEGINKRLKLVARLKTYKASRGYEFVDQAREDWMLAYLSRANRGPLSAEGLRLRADGERDRVARPRVDLDLRAVHRHRDERVKGVVAELGDRDPDDARVELSEHLRHEIVRHGPRRGRALELHEDRGGLRVADPDREEPVSVGRLQEHDRLLADHVEAHAVDDHLVHPPDLSSECTDRAFASIARGVGAKTRPSRHGEMGDPGFEPGPSALSERRSNQL